MLEPLDAGDPGRLGPYILEGHLGPAVYLGHDDAGTAAAVRVGALPGDRLAALGRVRSEHVAALLGADMSASPPWVATEYVAGPTLADVVGERGALPVPEVRALTAAVAGALVAIHGAGLAHGDLHAGNVVMAPGGARVVGFSEGSPDADVPALGRLVAFAAAGGDGAPAGVPGPLRDLVRRCLAEDPAERPSPAELAGARDPLAYQGVSPPANPLDLSAGIPADAAVGPLTAGAGAEPADDPLAYAAADPPENPLDLSTGIPSDSIVGPIPPDAETARPEPLTYPATEPPENPLDLSAGIPSDSIVGPIPADAEPDQPEPLTYPTTQPPPNPLDLSTGIPSDSIVGPVPPDAATNEPEPQTYPATEPPENPLDLSAGIPSDSIVGPIPPDAAGEPALVAATGPIEEAGRPGQPTEPAAATAPPIDPVDLAELQAAADAIAAAEPGGVHGAGHVLEPVAYADDGKATTRPPRPAPSDRDRRRRRLLLAGLAAALLIAAAATVPLGLDEETTARSPATPQTTAPPVPTTGPTCTGTTQLTAGGSALQRDAIATIGQRWAARCKGSVLDYTPGGTASGVQQFTAGEADFAVADHVLGTDEGELAAAAARCAGVGAPANKDLVLQVPVVLTPVVVAFHLTGIGTLRLDAPALAAIFDGRVTKWNHRAIVRLNPGLRLPATAITVIARQDPAQTTRTFQEYLTVAGDWRSGDGPEFTGKAAATYLSDSAVLAAIRDADGAIGYGPVSAARAIDVPAVSIVTARDRAAQPDSGAISTAADIATAGIVDYNELPEAIYHAGTALVGDGAAPYPLVHVGYVAACTTYADERTSAAIRDLLLTALGTQVGVASGYQLPFGALRSGLVDLVERTY